MRTEMKKKHMRNCDWMTKLKKTKQKSIKETTMK
jgi:hypothetical protein